MRTETDISRMPAGRQEAWAALIERRVDGTKPWDLLVIGGGITGAGILREAARRGLAAALIEQRDFAWGTSSRSSNMVHGGLRYLELGQVRMSRAAVRERERLMSEAAGLVSPMGFLFSDYQGYWPPRWALAGILTLYDFLSGRWNHRYYPVHEYMLLAPRIRLTGLKGGTRYIDAVTDDARLVFRIIREAQRDGALALNYVMAEQLIKSGGRVCGAAVRDALSGSTGEVGAKVVVNATGAWADKMRKEVGGTESIRPLRGSHLIFPFWRIPIGQTMALAHPVDRRYVFLMPWEGAALVGNTDLDHDKDLTSEASITPLEVDYLLEFVRYQFPSLGIKREDILSTWSGVRPVIGTSVSDPSKEKRDHAIWVEQGLVSVSGGKLTTFRLIALDVLRRVASFIPKLDVRDTGDPVFRQAEGSDLLFKELGASSRLRLTGRHGEEAKDVVECARDGELTPVPGTHTLWAEVRHAARTEAVMHLEDLLLRRTRLGVLLKQGGVSFLDRIKEICQEELNWDDHRWHQEAEDYNCLWQRCHSVP